MSAEVQTTTKEDRSQRVYRVYKAEGLMVRRLRRKRLSRVAVASHLVRSNQEWALDFGAP